VATHKVVISRKSIGIPASKGSSHMASAESVDSSTSNGPILRNAARARSSATPTDQSDSANTSWSAARNHGT
jgi:hypothetical protein